MTVSAMTRTEKTSAMLVEFSFGDPSSPTIYRFTDWKAPISLFGKTYAATPSMDVGERINTAGMNDKSISVTLPVNAFTANLSYGEPHAPVSVVVREYLIAEADSSADIIFIGFVGRTIQNHEGERERIRIECSNLKARFDIVLGISSTPHCAWTLFGKGCGLAEVNQTATITDIAKATLTMSGLTFPKPAYFHRGWVEVDGLRIGIRDHQATDTTMVLVREPPRLWLGRSAKVVPGCAKTIQICRSTWNNEQNFCGLGYAIPEYHPVIESP